MRVNDSITLQLVDETWRLQLYAHIADMDGDITSSTIRGYILPKQIGSSPNSLTQFIDTCLISFAVLGKGGYYAGLAGFLPQIDPTSRDAKLFMFLKGRLNRKDKEVIASFLTEYALSKLGMHRVSVSVLGNDQQSLDIFCGLGFTQEGIKRKAHWADGAWLDVYKFGVIDEEWKKLNEGKGAED